jgi:hypothetical protein
MLTTNQGRYMFRTNSTRIMALLLMVILSTFTVISCNNSPKTSSPGNGAVIQSDSIIIAEIKAVRAQKTGYPWEMDILVQNSENVGSLPNPTEDKIGQVITTKTDEDLLSLQVGQIITARVKYVGDVPKPGISLYIYNIKPQ